MLRGEIAREELEAKISASTRQYAKRQETWFRHQLTGSEVALMDVSEGAAVVAQRFVELWEKRKIECASE
jgi:tRNA A37 N6-isopentenylltransferase MiaA